MKVLKPMSGFPAWDPTKGLGIPREFDLEGQWDLITRLPRDWGKREFNLGGHKQNLIPTKTQERSSDHRRLNQNYLLVLEGLLWRCWSAGVHRRDKGTGSSILGRLPLGINPLGGRH